MSVNQLKKELQLLADPAKAKLLMRFFKTNKGDYGEGDIFLGIKVPEQRKIAKKYRHLTLRQLQKLLQSKIHEQRLVSLLILVSKYQKAKIELKKEIYDFYLKNTRYINNWDLVDLSAPKIVGDYLLSRSEKRKILYKFAQSTNLWQRRIAILATFPFIKKGEFKDSLKISRVLLKDKHDLIHKAVGWMLREIGKREQGVEEVFLKKYYHHMPRTMLRYAIERFSEKKRKAYLKGMIQ